MLLKCYWYCTLQIVYLELSLENLEILNHFLTLLAVSVCKDFSQELIIRAQFKFNKLTLVYRE